MEFVTGSNGGVAFRVSILAKDDSSQNEKIVSIFKQSDNPKQFIPPFFVEFETNPMMMFQTKEIFVGKSEKNKVTEFEGSFGSQYDGRSLLCQFGSERIYIFIERNITIFLTERKVTSFYSPIGHSGVLYAWAVDEQRNIYLLPSGPVLISDSIPKSLSIDATLDPWDIAYDNTLESKIKTKKLTTIAELSSRDEIIYSFRSKA